MVLLAGGGYAEYVAAHMGCVMNIPQCISMIDAAGKQRLPTTVSCRYECRERFTTYTDIVYV
jgi:hypothetical protein